MILVQLFISFLKVGLFSIGGGYAAMPLIQNEVVISHHWLSMSEFTDLITIAEMTPGPIAVNSSTFVGIRIAGIPGAIIATLGCIFPSLIIVSLLAYIYRKYKNIKTLQSVLKSLRPAIVSLILGAGISILLLALGDISSINYVSLILFSVGLFVLRKYKFNPIPVMVMCGIVNLVISLL